MAMPKAGGIINCQIKDIRQLYASYMPFINGGALFVPYQRQPQLGKEVFVVVTLPDSKERMPLNGKVVWVHHKGQGSRPAGFGIQLGADETGLRIKNEIERLLAGVDTDKSTFTL